MLEREVIKYEPSEPRYLTDEREKSVRVCAYCRVSSDKGEQVNSLESQMRFFESYFERRPNYVNVGIFSDEGISGTSLARRESFIKMLSLARSGKVDLILTKEVSRFSRNLLDTLKIIDELRRIGVYVYFISDDINTQNLQHCGDLANIANAAESESRRTSKRVRWGQKEQMKRGIVFGRSEMFGYRIVRVGDERKFEIVEAQAEVVRLIFRLFCLGEGTSKIAARMKKSGVEYYKNGWTPTNVMRILRNEKYVGDLTLGKTYTPDLLTHKKKYNRGQSFMITHKNHHSYAAIIDRATWDEAQRRLGGDDIGQVCESGTKEKYAKRYFCSGKIVCGACASKYISYTKKQKNGKYHAWICQRKHDGENCPSHTLNDKVIKEALKFILLNTIHDNEEFVISSALTRIKRRDFYSAGTKKASNLQRELEKIKAKLTALTDSYISGDIDRESYMTLKENYYKSKDKAERVLKALSDPRISPEKRFSERAREVLSFENDSDCEALFERILERVVVHDNNFLEIHLAFLSRAVFLRYKTAGKGKSYRAEFEYENFNEND